MKKKRGIIIIVIIIIMSTSFGFEFIPDLYQKSQINNTVLYAFQQSNTYSWKDDAFVKGIQYFTPQLQNRYFLNDYSNNIKYVKEHKVIATAKVQEIEEINIINNKKAKVSFELSQTLVENNKKTNWSSKIKTVLVKNSDGSWIISDINQSDFQGDNNLK